MPLPNTNVLTKLFTLPLDTAFSVEKPTFSSNRVNHSLGLILMLINKIRHEVKGYTSARGFEFADMERAINYDLRVVKRWMDYLEQYKIGSSTFKGKNILELGPGADLGIGLISLAEGAQSYNALDVHNLVAGTPNTFYEQLFDHLKDDHYLTVEIEELRHQLKQTQAGENDRLNYVCREDFDLSVFDGKNIDLVVSNSAFQQFDDPAKTIEQLSKITRSGAYFIALLDLKTHMRWLNQRDPLNIYRYSDTVYNFLKFKGAQNRVRPIEFKKMLEENNWGDVQIFTRLALDQEYLKAVNASLHPRFRDPKNQMEALTSIVCARKL